MKRILISLLMVATVYGQTSKTPIKNGVLQSNLDAAGFKVIGLPTPSASSDAATKGYADSVGGGAPAWGSITGKPTTLVGYGITDAQPLDTDLTSIAALTTTTYGRSLLTLADAAAGKTSLGLVIGTNVQAWDTDLDGWALKTPYAGTLAITSGKTLTVNNSMTLSASNDASTLNIATGGTLGTAAFTAATAYEVPLTFSTGLTRSTNTVTVNTSQNIATLSNLTTNGFVKTGGAVGTLSVDTATYQASNANLTSWAAITRASGIDTFATTPSSANLRSALTDENGTGAALFSGATTPDFTTGFTIGAAAAAGKVPIGSGTNYVPSTPIFPNTVGTTGQIVQSNGSTGMAYSTPTWPTTAGTAGYTLRSDGTNIGSYPQDMLNSSVTSQATFSTSDIYIAGSNVPVAAGDFKAKGQYHCVFDMTKSAGTGAIVISVRAGTLGTTGDTAQLTFTFGAGTSVADTGIFDVYVTWRTVGSGTSAVMQGVCRAQKNAATTTGLWNNAGTDLVIVATTSSGFASNTFTNLGLSFNGSTAFAGTGTLVQATLVQ